MMSRRSELLRWRALWRAAQGRNRELVRLQACGGAVLRAHHERARAVAAIGRSSCTPGADVSRQRWRRLVEDMLMQNLPLEDLTDRVRSHPRVWVRLAVSRPLDAWQLSLLEVTLGEPPPGWTRQNWLYASFVAAAPTGAAVARWIQTGRIQMKPVSLPAAFQDVVQAERRQSRFASIYQPLPWPSVEWKVPVRAENTQMLHGELVAR